MASSFFNLVGPPELHETPKPKPSSSGDPFMDLMLAKFNNTPNLNLNSSTPPRGYTENGSATFLSTTSPCLDFFFHVVPNTPAQSLVERLEKAWEHNDLTSLKLICHLRGVRGTGKSDKEGFYTAALWLHKHHPKTLACNVKWMAKFGYFKDLPELLYRLLEGSDVRKAAQKAASERKMIKNQRGGRGGFRGKGGFRRRGGFRGHHQPKKVKKNGDWKGGRCIPKEDRLAVDMQKGKIQKERAKVIRKEKEIAKARKAIGRYTRDPDYRFLHDQVSQVFADHLVSDMKSFNSGEFGKISLASKWCPSLDSSFDKSTLLCESIAKRVFPRESYPEYNEVEEVHYAYRVRDRLRKEVLVPLRQKLELPELYMSKTEWNTLPYERVASVAMTNYKKHFLKHDEERFNEYLGKVERGEAKIAAGALLPHEIIKSLNDGERDEGQVAELQWRRMVEDLRANGKLKNCVAVCDVSGSMEGTPMDVCVALGLLLSELSELPWKGKVITFSENPEIHVIEGDDLRSKTEFIKRMDWGANTDFQKVFDKILEVAVAGNLSADEMVKKVFVFSDMEFDAANGRKRNHDWCSESSDEEEEKERGGWDTDYEVIKRKFEKKGFTVPEMVFWDLRDSMATPVGKDEKGVGLVSGFSKNLMKLFLDEKEIPGPEAVMELAISGPEYKELVVVD